jgi:nicotinate-nucleotide adenylyltransferase
MKVGLYFGSFNPIHIGHLAIANYFVSFTDIDQLWFVLSPHNPLKEKKTLLDDYQRLEIMHRAINRDDMFRVTDIEFRMPQPSYTMDTLTYLKEKHPKHEFVLIMGSDGLKHFHKWKNKEEIERHHTRYVYPRPGTPEEEYQKHKNILIVDAPVMEISSSFIRQSIKEGKNVKYFMPPGAREYIDEMNFYR